MNRTNGTHQKKRKDCALEIGNRYDNILRFIVVERIRRYGSWVGLTLRNKFPWIGVIFFL